MNNNLSISIIEDHRDYRESIKLILDTTNGFECTGDYPSVEKGINHLENTDVLLLDVHLPGKSGIESIGEIKSRYPRIIILILTVFDDDNSITNAILEGADGYLLKKTTPGRLLQYLEDASLGGSVLSPSIARKAFSLIQKNKQKKNDFNLTQRELEVLNLVTNGLSNKIISEELFISVDTVRNHLRNIYKKLNVNSRTQAVIVSIRQGILD